MLASASVQVFWAGVNGEPGYTIFMISRWLFASNIFEMFLKLCKTYHIIDTIKKIMKMYVKLARYVISNYIIYQDTIFISN